MVVRVRVKLKPVGSDGWIKTSALIISGYEADKPELVIPLALAKALGLKLDKASVTERTTPIGLGRLYYLEEALELKLTCEDRETPTYRVNVLISEYEYEVLISDYLASMLSIAIEDLKEGLWRFRDEALDKLRASAKPSYWLAE
ncbi:MAG: hypothetical protein QXK12_01880 [Candidatus Nezhaarchaeales archaeon]